jgi:hypothetical protein
MYHQNRHKTRAGLAGAIPSRLCLEMRRLVTRGLVTVRDIQPRQ